MNQLDSQALLAELPRLRRYARALVGDRAGADDLVQDTLERAWANAAQWRPGKALRPWLFGIMHNLRIDQYRRNVPPLYPLDDAAEVATRATQGDRLDVLALDAALARLPEEQRQVLLLVSLEEMSYGEVASALGIPPGTVMSRLARGRERLRQLLDEPQPSPRLRVVK